MALSDLPLLHEQACTKAVENRQAVKRLKQSNAVLKTEADDMRGYIESALINMMEVDAAVPAGKLQHALPYGEVASNVFFCLYFRLCYC